MKKFKIFDDDTLKGKFYALIDYLVITSALCFSAYHSFPLTIPKYLHIPGTNEYMVAGLFSVLMSYSLYKTYLLNAHKNIPKEKKHSIEISFFLGLLVSFILLLFRSESLINHLLFRNQLPLEQIMYHFDRLYFLNLRMLLFALIRCLFAFDYYQAFYYKKRKCYMGYICVYSFLFLVGGALFYMWIMSINFLFRK